MSLQKGFQFLLEDVNSQLWSILLKYLDGAEEKGMDTVEVLAFLFMLGSLELGRVGFHFTMRRQLLRMSC